VTFGKLEYIVIGFAQDSEGKLFDGSIEREIEKVVRDKTIRLVDVVLVAKTSDGTIMAMELDNENDPRFDKFAPILADRLKLFTPDDLDSIAMALEAGTVALVVLFEHRWAESLKEAIAAAGGFVVARETIPSEIVEEIEQELSVTQASAG
jgi:uncharacterized membrane protein